MNVRDLIPWSRNHREVSRGFGSPQLWGGRNEWPTTNVEETNKEYRVTAELPGIEERDVEVRLQDGVLTLRGEKKVESESRNRAFNERFYGRFERQLSFDRAVDDDGVNASFHNGVRGSSPHAPEHKEVTNYEYDERQADPANDHRTHAYVIPRSRCGGSCNKRHRHNGGIAYTESVAGAAEP